MVGQCTGIPAGAALAGNNCSVVAERIVFGSHDSSRENYNWQGAHWTAVGGQPLTAKGGLQKQHRCNDRIGLHSRGQE